MSDVRIRMEHIRAAKMCSSGTRDFFKRYNLDWQDFLKNGIDAEEFRKTKNELAMQVVRIAENGR